MRDSGDGLCVLECILTKMAGVDGYKKYTMERLIKEFEAFGINVKHGITCEDISKWVIRGGHRVSVYGFDPLGNLEYKQKAINPNHQKVVKVAFVVNDNHCNLLSPSITTSAEHGRKDISGFWRNQGTQQTRIFGLHFY